MKLFKKIFTYAILSIFILNLATFEISVSAAPAAPKLQILSNPKSEYKLGDTLSFSINCPKYSGKVEYKVDIVNKSTKKSTTLWDYTGNQYYIKGQKPSGTTKINILWPLSKVQPGVYSIKVFVRRSGSKSSGESSVETKSISVIQPKAIISIDTINVSVDQYDTYNPPKFVKAKYNNGEINDVAISWESKSIDTNEPGDYIITGKVSGYGKAVNLCVKVKPIAQNDEGNTDGNIRAGGVMTSQGDWIFYSYDGLWKMKKDGTKKTLISDMTYARYLNVVGKWIYYVNSIDNKIYKITTNGKDKTKLADERVGYMKVVKDWIYFQCVTFDTSGTGYSSDGPLYRMKIDGTNKVEMTNHSGSFVVQGDYIYYIKSENSSTGTMVRMKTDGSEETEISTDRIMNFNVSDGWIYYGSYDEDGRLCRIKVDGTDKQYLGEGTFISDIHFVEDWIYYTETLKYNFGLLYKMKKDGSSKTQLTSYPVRFVNITGGYITFQNEKDLLKFNLYKLAQIKY